MISLELTILVDIVGAANTVETYIHAKRRNNIKQVKRITRGAAVASSLLSTFNFSSHFFGESQKIKNTIIGNEIPIKIKREWFLENFPKIATKTPTIRKKIVNQIPTPTPHQSPNLHSSLICFS